MSENHEYIPDYKSYDIYNLVEIYRRIDHKTNQRKIKLIEEQIRIKLNIDSMTELNNPNVQKQFDKILLYDKPIVGQEKQDSEGLKILRIIQISMLVFGFILQISVHLGKDNNLLIGLSFMFLCIFFLIAIYEGFKYDEVYSFLLIKNINRKDNPVAIAIQQIIFFFIVILIIAGIIRNIL